MNLNDLFTEEKVRLDPKCWTGKKIGNPKTKMKGGTRVNNCVPAESINEFAPPGGDDREPNEEEILRQLAAQWWLGTEQQMAKAQQTLAAMGWEIGQDESGDDDAGVFLIRAGDANGNSYMAFNHSDLEDLAEGLTEMDKSQTPPGRDGSNDSDASKKEYTAKATTPKKVAKDAEKILNKELSKKQGVAEGAAETVPWKEAQKVLNHYGADYFGTSYDKLYFYKYRKQFSIGLIRDEDSNGNHSVNLSELNAMVRKLRSMRVPLSPFGESVTEGSQQVDSIVTDALKIMRGSTMDDAVQALKTVLGDREYNSRRGYYNFYVRQILDMYGQQGVAEKLGDNRPNLGSKRDAGKSVRKWRSERGLDETDVAEDLTRRGFLRGLGAAALAGAAGSALAGSDDSEFPNKVQKLHSDMMEKNPRYAKEHEALGIALARGFVGAAAENNKRWYQKTAELLQKYGVKVNEGVAEDQLDEKSTSQAQFRTMAAAAHNPEFAKKVGISRDVAQEFHGADRKQDYTNLPKKADESKSASKEKEADYGADYQDMVSRVKKLAGLGPLKTVWDPAKRVYRNVPTAVQPKK